METIEELKVRLVSLKRRYQFIAENLNYLNRIERLANLGEAIIRLKDEIVVKEMNLCWKQWGF
jgi:uncharacterized protein with HEPN domain